MGKGKKKARGKGKIGVKTNDNACGGRGGGTVVEPPQEPEQEEHQGPTPEQWERARLAAANRTNDPLKSWIRPGKEECPICMIPLPLLQSDSCYLVCCGKTICGACDKGQWKVDMEGQRERLCPFCRRTDDFEYNDERRVKQVMKLADAGHHDALEWIALTYFKGEMGLRQDKAEGLKWYRRAVEAGNGKAAYSLGYCYWQGDGVDKDCDKAMEYFSKAADHGYVPAFFVMGSILVQKGDIEEGVLNIRKAAVCGLCDENLFGVLRNGFRDGFITKEEYAVTLRGNQTACNEMKSEAREGWKTMLSEGTGEGWEKVYLKQKAAMK